MTIEIRSKRTDEILLSLQNETLRGASLSGAKLSGANLCGADLSGADLRYSDFSDADLSGADLRGADLRRASFAFTELIDGGERSDGWRFVGWIKGGELQIRAGCRNFNISEAREHWIKTRGGTRLGQETMAILFHIELLARIRGLLKEP